MKINSHWRLTLPILICTTLGIPNDSQPTGQRFVLTQGDITSLTQSLKPGQVPVVLGVSECPPCVSLQQFYRELGLRHCVIHEDSPGLAIAKGETPASALVKWIQKDCPLGVEVEAFKPDGELTKSGKSHRQWVMKSPIESNSLRFNIILESMATSGGGLTYGENIKKTEGSSIPFLPFTFLIDSAGGVERAGGKFGQQLLKLRKLKLQGKQY